MANNEKPNESITDLLNGEEGTKEVAEEKTPEEKLKEAAEQPKVKKPVKRTKKKEEPVVTDKTTRRELGTPEGIAAQEEARTGALKDKEDNDTLKMFNDALDEEDKRFERIDNALKNDEIRADLQPEGANIEYNPNMDVEDERPKRKQRVEEMVDEDWLPSYDDEDVPKEEREPEIEEVDDEDDEDLSEVIRTMDVLEYESEVESPAKEIRKKGVADIKKQYRNRTFSNDAFLTEVNKFKKENFASFTVPLINSGFIVQLVGSGVNELTQLYTNVNSNIDATDYELFKMRTILKGVIGSKPHIDSMKLSNRISYSDYTMMAWGHVCATLETVQNATTCPKCSNNFRITAKPEDLLINKEEILERAALIEASTFSDEYSLLTKGETLITRNGFAVTIAPPSYKRAVDILNETKAIASTMSDIEAKSFEEITPILHMITSITAPSGLKSNTLFQSYTLTTTMEPDDLIEIANKARVINEGIITPRFGAKDVCCPKCKHVINEIPYDNDITSMVFYHTTVSNLLNQPDES